MSWWWWPAARYVGLRGAAESAPAAEQRARAGANLSGLAFPVAEFLRTRWTRPAPQHKVGSTLATFAHAVPGPAVRHGSTAEHVLRGGFEIVERPASTTDVIEASIVEGKNSRPTSRTEGALVEVLAGVVQVDCVTVDSHFFDDLGADSMVMAQFCARVRKRADLPSVSMKDIYRHPTIKSLAAALTQRTPDPRASTLSARRGLIMPIAD